MPKPYSLNLYSSIIRANEFITNLPAKMATGWRRSIRSNGGCWLGSFDVNGSASQLQQAFESWLGCELRERAGGMLSWSGLVYEMDLTLNGVTRRRSLDNTLNRVKTTHTDTVYGGDNFVRNPSLDFATVVGGANDNFDAWYENAGAPALSIKWDNAIFYVAGGGIASMRMTGNGSNPLDDPLPANMPWARQNMNITPGAKYQVRFWVRGDGGAAGPSGAGYYGIRDPNAAEWLWGPYPVGWTSAANWYQVTAYVTGPADGEIMLFFFAPPTTGRIAYFDDAEILEEGPYVLDSNWATIGTDGNPTESDPADSPPIVRYGLKEEILELDSYPVDTAISYRDTYLKENCWPWARPVAAAKAGEAKLHVIVAGWAWTMNWLYLQNNSGEQTNLNTWIELIVGSEFGRSEAHGGSDTNAGDCQFVKAGNIGTNTLQTWQTSTVDERPWDVIQELISLGDGADNLWRGWVDPNRLFHYLPIVIAPRYYIRRDGIYDTMSGSTPSNPWLMQPAVFRDLTYRTTATEIGLFLPDPRDIYVEEVEMADGWDQPALKTALYSEADLLLQDQLRGPPETGPQPQYMPL